MSSPCQVIALLAAVAMAVGMSAGCSAPPPALPVTAAAATPTTAAVASSPTTAPKVSTPTIAKLRREPGPDLLHDHTQSGAEAYVKDYLSRLNDSWTRPQASLLDNRASKDCGTCTNFRDAAANLAREGRRHEGPILVVSNVSVVIWSPDVRVVADVRQPKHDLVDRKGRKVRSVQGGRVFLYVELSYSGRWWIKSVGIDPVNDDGTHRES